MPATLNSEISRITLNGNWSTYSVYGLTLASDFPFSNQLIPGVSAPDLTFSCTMVAPAVDDLKPSNPSSGSLFSADDDESNFTIYRRSSYDVLHFANSADFYLWSDRIICHLFNPEQSSWVEIGLLGAVLSFWLERKNICTLHASAVVVEGYPIAFLASSGSGKSSLAATFVQAGYPMLTDDILPVELCGDTVIGHPGYCQMRLWPDQAQHFLGYYQDLEQVHPNYSKRRITISSDSWGNFCYTSQPLSYFYLLDRREPAKWGEQIEITPVRPPEVLRQLVLNSFLSGIMEPTQLQPQRFHRIAELAQMIQMRRLIYPSGLEYLPRLRDAIVADCRNSV